MNQNEIAGTTRAWSWHHSGVVVPNVDIAVDYYRLTLGFELLFEDRLMTDWIQRTMNIPGITCHIAQCQLPLGGHVIEFLSFTNIPKSVDARMPVWPGIGHSAFLVEDLDRGLSEIESAGGSRIGEIVEFPEGRAVYCWSSSGTVVELEEAPQL